MIALTDGQLVAGILRDAASNPDALYDIADRIERAEGTQFLAYACGIVMRPGVSPGMVALFSSAMQMADLVKGQETNLKLAGSVMRAAVDQMRSVLRSGHVESTRAACEVTSVIVRSVMGGAR